MVDQTAQDVSDSVSTLFVDLTAAVFVSASLVMFRRIRGALDHWIPLHWTLFDVATTSARKGRHLKRRWAWILLQAHDNIATTLINSLR